MFEFGDTTSASDTKMYAGYDSDSDSDSILYSDACMVGRLP
jgi:hypothetical protein